MLRVHVVKRVRFRLAGASRLACYKSFTLAWSNSLIGDECFLTSLSIFGRAWAKAFRITFEGVIPASTAIFFMALSISGVMLKERFRFKALRLYK